MRKRRSSPSDDSHEEPAPELSEVRARALSLLARREHSAADLQRKLEARGYPEDLIETAVAGLRAEGLLSEGRFAEEFVRSHVARGQGPLKIRAELRAQNVPDEEIEAAFAANAADWAELAAQQRMKRFGQALPRDFGERAKQARFLESRGFGADDIRTALMGSSK